MSDLLAEIERELRAARKYRHLCDETIRRTAAWALARHPDQKEAVKAAKRKLHQVFAAYAPPGQIERLASAVAALPPNTQDSEHRASCRELLRQHASTAERIDSLDRLYPAVWNVTGVPRSVLDLACGYQPFALPWMGLASAEYFACEIDLRLVAAINAYLVGVGRSPTAECRDLLAGVPTIAVDVALLFKALPCLEQQETGAALRVLRALRSKWVVVSFPLESLGGRGKGMRAHYTEWMAKLAAELQLEPRAIEFPNELFWALRLDQA